MARTREFDLDTVLDQAMRVFWRRGYVGTSMSDIYAATGLKPGSLYAAFQDKEQLFRRAFERYAERFRATLPKDISGLPAIAQWLRLQAKLAVEDDDRAGCLIINTVAERDAHSPATQALAQGRLQEIRDFFLQHLNAAIRDGDLPSDSKAEAHADALLGAVVSIMTLGRAGADKSVIDHVAAAAYAGLNAERGK